MEDRANETPSQKPKTENTSARIPHANESRKKGKYPNLFFQQLMAAVFMRTGKPIKEISMKDITQEDVERAPKL